MNNACLKTVVGGKQRHACCAFAPHGLFLCQSNVMEIMRLLTKMR